MISTKEVIKVLKEKYDMVIDRSQVFHYHKKYGFPEKIKKVSYGRSKGIETFWEDSAPYKIYAWRNHALKDKSELIKIILNLEGLKNGNP